MPDYKQLPYVLQLIDDDSPSVRKAIIKELDSYGPFLNEELNRITPLPDEEHISLAIKLIGDHRRECFRKSWRSWIEIEESVYKLEEAFNLVSVLQNGEGYETKLGNLLDDLAGEFKKAYPDGNEFALAKFLFSDYKLSGTEDDYYNYRNSELIFVLDEKQGIPISLVSILILIGDRLGHNIEGCNYPGHFLAKVKMRDEVFMIDCFYGGKIMPVSEFEKHYLASSTGIEKLLSNKPSATDIFRRVLLNLNRAYNLSNDKDNSDFVLEILKDLSGPEESQGLA